MNDENITLDAQEPAQTIVATSGGDSGEPGRTEVYNEFLGNHLDQMKAISDQVTQLTSMIQQMQQENEDLKQQLSQQYTSTTEPGADTTQTEIEAFLDRPGGAFQRYMASRGMNTKGGK